MQPIHVLAVGRIAAGLGPYLAPTVTGPLIGVGGPPEAHLATRLFGGRDVALGLATLTFTGDQRRGVIRAGIVADVLDIAAAGLGLRQKSLPGSQAGLLAALAAGAIVIGARELGTGSLMPDTTYAPTPDRTLKGYLAQPRGDGPFPGVVVIMDALGLSDDIRVQADRLAAAGYLAFAPDLYSGRGLKCVLATIQASRAGTGEAYTDIEAARRWLEARDDCTGKIGIIGFCMGGGFALLSAPRFDFQASSVNYGEVPDDAARRLAGACPIVASYGARDRMMQGRAEKLEAALESLEIPHDVKEYPGAGHSFMNRISTGPLGPIVRFVGMNYEHAAAEDAWARIGDFFERYLQSD